MRKALEWANTITEITEDEIDTILQTKKALLFFDGQCWIKKGNSSFDVSMGSWDGAEVADLIGLYLLSQLEDVQCNLGLWEVVHDPCHENCRSFFFANVYLIGGNLL